MSIDNYKLKYIKYKKKYNELKNLKSNISNIVRKLILLPKEYFVLSSDQKSQFTIYEQNDMSEPISYIKLQYLNKIGGSGSGCGIKDIDQFDTLTSSNKEEETIMEKEIISPDEYFMLSDTNKSKYEINESDFNKFPNRVVPKNYKKFIPNLKNV